MNRACVAVVVLIGVLGCGGKKREAPPKRDDVPAVADDPYRVGLNLDFEQLDVGHVRKWTLGGPGHAHETVAPDATAHGGQASLRLDGGANFATASVTVDAAALRGKRVRVSGWIQTDAVAAPGWAGFWIRTDGGAQQVIDNSQHRGLVGTAAWRASAVEVDVPADAVTVVMGAILVGAGKAWFDDLRLDVSKPTPRAPIVIGGVVRDPDGAVLGGAQVALVGAQSSAIEAVTVSGADGRFHFDVMPGLYGVSALHAGAVGAFQDAQSFGPGPGEVTLTLGRDGGVTVHGKVIGPVAPDSIATVAPTSEHDSDLFAVPIAADGTFTAVLPRGDVYTARLRGTPIDSPEGKRVGDAVELVIDASMLAPAPPAVADWIRDHGVPIASADPSTGTEDLAPLRAMIGGAHLVGLGEATHGTREFFQLKHRLVEYLVGELGFTVFALEANQPECRAINAYVVDGTGDPKAALAGVYFWTWNTEEVLAMIEWMRAWNADPHHRRKVHFVGIDMQEASVAYANVAAFLQQVDAAVADRLLVPIAPYARHGTGQLAADVHAAVAAGLAKVAERFALQGAAWRRSAGAAAYDTAEHDLHILGQANRMYAAGPMARFDARDDAMADNVDWILAHEPRGTRMIVWAHNGHVSRAVPGRHDLGSLLVARHGADYLALGFVFGQGSFQAMDRAAGATGGLDEITLGPAPAWDVSAPFTAAGHAIVAVDLRAATGEVARWFATPHPMRDTGAVFTTEANMSAPAVLHDRFDLVIFVDKTTRARPVSQ